MVSADGPEPVPPPGRVPVLPPAFLPPAAPGGPAAVVVPPPANQSVLALSARYGKDLPAIGNGVVPYLPLDQMQKR